jgi:hypothetical protein
VSLNALADVVPEEAARCELATAIGKQCAKFSLGLGLDWKALNIVVASYLVLNNATHM